MPISGKLIIVFVSLILIGILIITILLLTRKTTSINNYTNSIEHQYEILDYNVVLCMCVRNCGKYLKSIFNNIDRLGKCFRMFQCIFVYDNCSDNSAELLEEYRKKSSYNVTLINNIGNDSPYRTVRIANARNRFVKALNMIEKVDFHIVIDPDDVNIYPWNLDVILPYLNRSDWDCLTFNRYYYYDIWALLYGKYRHHCWGFGDMSGDVVSTMNHDIEQKLSELKNNELLDCFSAFNGFGIYRTSIFRDCVYDGYYENIKKYFTDEERAQTLEFLKQQMLSYGIDSTNLKIDEDFIEIAEHANYHLSAIQNKGAKIRISKDIYYTIPNGEKDLPEFPYRRIPKGEKDLQNL